MGTLKDRLMDTEEKWNAKCAIEGWKCSSCGTYPPYDDREIFLSIKSKTELGLCSTCAHRMEKTLN